jgi:hypothetical protein
VHWCFTLFECRRAYGQGIFLTCNPASSKINLAHYSEIHLAHYSEIHLAHYKISQDVVLVLGRKNRGGKM